MTTNTTSTASQAPALSIDSPEFRQKLAKLVDATHGAFHTAIEELIAHVDAKLSLVEDAAWLAGRQQCYADALERSAVSGLKHDRDGWKERATAAEAKLEAIRQGVEKLADRMYDALPASPMDVPDDTRELWAIKRELSDLIEQQHQADESGLPG